MISASVIHSVPWIHIRNMAVDLDGSMTRKWHLAHPWLVACGDMLLMVGCQKYSPSTGDTFEAFRLDLSTGPAKWVKVEKVENWAIFISIDERSQGLCCMNPERWGGRSNCIYCYDYDYNNKGWIACELGQPLQEDVCIPKIFVSLNYGPAMHPMWVVPSMF